MNRYLNYFISRQKIDRSLRKEILRIHAIQNLQQHRNGRRLIRDPINTEQAIVQRNLKVQG